MQTKYQVMMDFARKRTITTEIKDKNGNVVKNESTTKFIASLEKKEYVYVQHYKYNKNLTNETRYLGYAKKDDGSVDTTKAYIDNTDPKCFVLDYDSFLYGVNLALAKLSGSITKTDGFEDFKNTYFAYFAIYNGVLRFYYHRNLRQTTSTTKSTTDATTGNITTITTKYEWSTRNDILFSPELYKYIGNGFPCSFADEKQYPEYKGWWRINYINKFFNNHGTETPIGPSYFSGSGNYDYIIQAYPTFSNWNILKAIIIGSNNLPVVEEYLPISNKDGFLTHYNTPEYKKSLKRFGH